MATKKSEKMTRGQLCENLGASIKRELGAIAKRGFTFEKSEAVNKWHDVTFKNVFQYAHVCERCFEDNLQMIKGEERKTTFMSDLSIAEWCSNTEALNGILDTILRSTREYCDDLNYMCELSLCVAWKGEEHAGRGNMVWAQIWYAIFRALYDVMTAYYKNDREKSYGYWSYLD